MAKFITTNKIPTSRYRNNTNKAINLDMCTTMHKVRYNTYPDNKGVPAIMFSMFSGVDEHWVFDRIEDRDSEFYDIVKGVK